MRRIVAATHVAIFWAACPPVMMRTLNEGVDQLLPATLTMTLPDPSAIPPLSPAVAGDGVFRAEEVGASSILLVDDTEVLRERLAMAMSSRGFAVVTAGDYEEAVRKFSATPTELAVLDLRMPGRSGLDLLRRLLEIRPNTRVIMLSGFGSIPASIDAVRAGAVNFLSKPADADDILGAFIRGDGPTVPEGGLAFPAPSLARNEWEHIHRVLSDCGGNISEAARRLGIHRRSLQRKLRKRAPRSPLTPDADDVLETDEPADDQLEASSGE